MRKDNPFYENRLSKTAPVEVLEKVAGLENPLERALWALETPYLLPQSYTEAQPLELFQSILDEKPIIDLPHCVALVAFFKDDFKKAKELFEAAPPDPYTTYNLILCHEALGEREASLTYWQNTLSEDLPWIERIAIYEHLRTNYALHDVVLDDLSERFANANPDVMLKLLSHLALHKDFDLADEFWMKGAIEHEELEEYGVDLALAAGKLPLAISRLKNLANPSEKARYVEDFIKVVALKSLEDGDLPAALEMTETLLKDFYTDLSDEDKLLYLRLKSSCSLQVLKNEVDLEQLTQESKQNLMQALIEMKRDLEREIAKIKALAEKLQEEIPGSEDAYLAYLDELISLIG